MLERLLLVVRAENERAPGRAARGRPPTRPRPRRGRRARSPSPSSNSSDGPTTRASAAESPEVRIGSALAARIDTRSPSTRSASAPSASARCAASGPSTATISEMPSPSDMAWLRRLGPVTRRNGTSGDFLYRDPMPLRLAIVVLAAALPALAAGAVQKTVLGTPRADFLVGTETSDRIVARGGNDRIAAEYDGGVDSISCGTGRDVVVADARDRIDADCEVVSRRIHRDRHTNPESQHESEVEPDSQTVGQTTVARLPGRAPTRRGRREHRLLDLQGRRPHLARGHPARADREHDAARAIVACQRSGGRVRRRARRLAREHARDRARMRRG